MAYIIAPSILSADMTRLGEEVQAVMDAGADMIHYDVMDQHYVPNLTFGPVICSALHKRFPTIKFDVHLMVKPVDELIQAFAKAGAHRISIHPDATIHLDRSLDQIRHLNCKTGLVLNPSTSPECLKWCHHRLDFVLVMTVNPGFGGQSHIPEVKRKISWIKHHFPELPICVDGGISVDTIADIAQAGATEFVVGSALFSNPQNYALTIQQLRQQIDKSQMR